jgi:hypothetical protein
MNKGQGGNKFIHRGGLRPQKKAPEILGGFLPFSHPISYGIFRNLLHRLV